MGTQNKGTVGHNIETATGSVDEAATGWLKMTAGEIASVLVLDTSSMSMTVLLECRVFDDDEGGDVRVYTVETGYTAETVKNFEAGETCEIRLRVDAYTSGTSHLRVAKG